jgi:hypothetical protein
MKLLPDNFDSKLLTEISNLIDRCQRHEIDEFRAKVAWTRVVDKASPEMLATSLALYLCARESKLNRKQ